MNQIIYELAVYLFLYMYMYKVRDTLSVIFSLTAHS